ncbi:aldo/keto reductase [Saccharopolyspora shandongensis]|uniref:aldo/keto reductase n=1 Tax=Saccharopolyspora shandongensis TaxID=418495 RepID=UPI0033CF6B17
MDRAHEHGINFFDTANVYGARPGGGVTEEIIGRWFAAGSGRCERTVPATKSYLPMGDWPNERFLSALNIRRACEASLERLSPAPPALYAAVDWAGNATVLIAKPHVAAVRGS